MELAEEKAPCQLPTACVKRDGTTASSSARRRQVSEAKGRFCSICLIADLFRWDQVLELHMLPPGFPQSFVPRGIFPLSASGSPGPSSNLLGL